MRIAEAETGVGAKWALYVSMALAALCVVLLTVFSNHYDWDAFYALAEVDYRAWWVDHELPLWSYQLCAGISRIADPQAFGLSPLFIWVLIFGSFWGLKLLVLSSLALGVFFTARLMELVHRHASEQSLPGRLYVTLAMLFVFGNYFMWHLLVGHVTFGVMSLAVGIVYLTLKGYLEGLSRWEFGWGTLLAWQHYSGAFYHSTIYFLVPFFVAFGIFGCVELIRQRREPGVLHRFGSRLRQALGFNVAGIVLGGYKIWAAWSYSRGIGRRHDVVGEVLDPTQVGFQLLVPTWHREFLFEFDLGNFWDVHEYSAFSLLVPLALAVGLCTLARRPGFKGLFNPSSVGLFAGIYLFVAFLFSLGDFAMLSPYGLVNRLLLSGEARIIGRFHVGIVLALGMVLMVLLRLPSRRPWLGDIAGVLLLAGLIGNLAGFATLMSKSQLQKILSYPSEPSALMQSWRRIKLFLPYVPRKGDELRPDATVNMYQYVLKGEGILNCYNALPRLPGRAPRRFFVPLINASATAPSPQCGAKSRYTQNRIILSEACRDLVCVNAAHINPYGGTPLFEITPGSPGFCARLPGKDAEDNPLGVGAGTD